MQEVERSGVSTDSGVYNDWQVSGQNSSLNFQSNGSAQFVSVISVENNEPIEKSYVTVVSVDGDNDGSEEVLVYRLPGERLGFGLKFDGGIRNTDKVSRLFIQSCAGDSPASRTHPSWGSLGPGDEIIRIDGIRVDSMTRTDCVRALKESAVVIKLEVKRKSDNLLPPPIPPRKCLRRRQSDSQVIPTVQQQEPTIKTRSCGVAQAEIYTDLFAESTIPTESESDDTSSSLSTVVSRVSSTANSSFSDGRSNNSADVSPPSTVKASTPYDLDKVLEPFLQLERELSSSTLDSGSLFTRLVEASTLLEPATSNPGSTTPGSSNLPPRPVPRISTVSNNSEPIQQAIEITTNCPPPPPRIDIPRPPPPPRPILHPPPPPPPLPPPPPPPLPPPPNKQQDLPRLIDFVPKGRTDVLIPSPTHILHQQNSEENTDATDDSRSTTRTALPISRGKMEINRVSTGYSTVVGNDNQFRSPPDGHEIVADDNPNLQRIRTRSGSCNDERSEKSVRDKIAMFSEQSAKCNANNGIFNGRRVSATDIVRPNRLPVSPPLKRDEIKIIDQIKPKSIVDNKIGDLGRSGQETSTLPRPERNSGTTLTRAVSFTGGTKLHSRSQSLVNIGSRAALKSEDSRRLSTMIEQRRRCMSKLRGLVIPEKVSEVPHFVDLPEIKSRDCPLPVSKTDKEQMDASNTETTSLLSTNSINKIQSSPIIPSPPWKSSDTNFPKYSPAFKRKSLTIYGTNNSNISTWFGSNSNVAENANDDYVTSCRLTAKQDVPNIPSNIKGKESKDTESDSDSAVSSSRSDLSHSPTNELSRLSITRTLSDETNSSTESTLTSESLNSQVKFKNNKTTSQLKENAFTNKEQIREKITLETDQMKPKTREDIKNTLKQHENKFHEIPLRIETLPIEIPTVPFINDHSKIKNTKHTMPIFKNNNNNNINNNNNNNITNSNIKKHFEKTDGQIKLGGNIQHPRVSSIDSTTSDDSFFPTTSMPYGSVTNLQREQQFGSISSLASSTSLISQQELSQLIEEANHTLEESHEVVVVILHRDNPGGSIGITLAGGADYEAKEITVHKVLVGSPAERDGRIQKGDRILSINGRSMKGLTHYESLAILKAPRPEVVLVVSRCKAENQEENAPLRCHTNTLRSPRYIEPVKYTNPPADKENEVKWGPVESVILHKDGTGLGFSLEGGKDSPYGDMPLTVKKIFTGGCAEKCGLVCAGDELLSVNGIDVSALSRIEAWALMKRLPDGKVTLAIRHPLTISTT